MPMDRFRLVTWKLDSFRTSPHNRARREALNSLPPDLSSEYERLLGRTGLNLAHFEILLPPSTFGLLVEKANESKKVKPERVPPLLWSDKSRSLNPAEVAPCIAGGFPEILVASYLAVSQ